MKQIVLMAVLCLLLSPAIAQNTGSITGSVLHDQKPVAGATISLLKASDSSTVKLSVAGKDGLYYFENIHEGNYLVSVTATGFQKSFTSAIQLDAQNPETRIPAISLLPLENALADVTVTARRPLVEQKIDRTIVNVDASVTNIGTSALEVLEKSPGVMVDSEGNISLKGKEGVLIMVDGRPTQLSGADLANLLRNMNSSQLHQIEIMTNPPARYDAAGNSGIINILTKKIMTAGLNGSATASYSQGKYPKTNEGFNFNYRKGKLNFFTNLSHIYMKRYLTLNIDRNILNSDNQSVENIFNQEATKFINGNALSARVGVDLFATKNSTIGAVVNFNSRKSAAVNPNITYISDASSELETVTNALVDNKMQWQNISTNFYFRRQLGKKGREITSDVDIARHRMQNDQFMVNTFTDASGFAYKKTDSLVGTLPQQIDIYSARVDYTHPLKNDTRFEAGIKSSFVRTDNTSSYDSIQFGNIIHDYNRSNHFIYEENINAAYVNLRSSLSKKLSVQLGLRLENTNAKGKQKTTEQNFSRNYTQLFPTAYFQYQLNEKNVLGANFGRRVRRPGYHNLNPFIRFIDRYTYSQGNPNLKPSISNNAEISHTWNNKITTTLNYTRTTDVMKEIIQQKGQEAYNTPDNVAAHNQFGISVNANLHINSWWTSSAFVNVFHDQYTGTINDDEIDMAATGFSFNTTQQFKISKIFTAEITGMYRSGWMEGVMRIKPFGVVGAGISHKVLKNKGTIKLSARDIFHTQRMRGSSRYANVDFNIRQVAETQVVTIGFTYSFSKGKKIAPVKRTQGSAAEEESRIGQ